MLSSCSDTKRLKTKQNNLQNRCKSSRRQVTASVGTRFPSNKVWWSGRSRVLGARRNLRILQFYALEKTRGRDLARGGPSVPDGVRVTHNMIGEKETISQREGSGGACFAMHWTQLQEQVPEGWKGPLCVSQAKRETHAECKQGLLSYHMVPEAAREAVPDGGSQHCLRRQDLWELSR